MNYQILGQRDPRWASHLLGNSATSTIGGWGCLITCFAELAGVDVQTMNDWMKAHGGFQPEPRGGYSAIWDVSGYNQQVRLIGSNQEYLSDPVPPDILKGLVASVSQVTPMIVMVNHIPGIGAVTSHFILCIDVSEDGKIIILDPWFGDISTLDRYGADYAVAICAWFKYSIGAHEPVVHNPTFTATPLSITQGQGSTLAWNCPGASGIFASWLPSPGGVSGPSDSWHVTPTQTTTYTLTVKYAGQADVVLTQTVTVAPVVTPPPVVVPPGYVYPKLGVNFINYGKALIDGDNGADGAAYVSGCKSFLGIGAPVLLAQAKARHPEIIVINRAMGTSAQLSGGQVASVVGGGPNGVIYLPYNEYDNFAGATEVQTLKARCGQEQVFINAMLPKGAMVSFGAWPMGCPNFNDPEVCAVITTMAPFYNNNPNVYVDMHLYSPDMKHIYRTDNDQVWYERRWEFLFTKCGFDPKAGQKVLSSETGVAISGQGGFASAKANADDFANWCNAWQSLQAKPLIINGASHPSPFLAANIFAYTAGTDPSWLGYDVAQYFQAAAPKIRWY